GGHFLPPTGLAGRFRAKLRRYFPNFTEIARWICWPRGPQFCYLAAQGRLKTGDSLVAATPDSCCDGSIADRCAFRLLSHSRPGARPVGRLRGIEPRGPRVAGRAVEGRAVARRLHVGEAAQRRIVSD